jgi:hypothetical protein
MQRELKRLYFTKQKVNNKETTVLMVNESFEDCTKRHDEDATFIGQILGSK